VPTIYFVVTDVPPHERMASSKPSTTLTRFAVSLWDARWRYAHLMEFVDLDPRWDTAIELLLDCHSHKSVAVAVGCHRNTISNWMRTSAFRVELARRSDERNAAAKQRLAIVTTKLVDRLGRLAYNAMDAAERDPTNRRAQRAARDWLRNYRELCRVEAQILAAVVHPT
jgi:hypothetical protein